MTLTELLGRLAEIEHQIQAISREARWQEQLARAHAHRLAILEASETRLALTELEAVTERLSSEVAGAEFTTDAVHVLTPDNPGEPGPLVVAAA